MGALRRVSFQDSPPACRDPKILGDQASSRKSGWCTTEHLGPDSAFLWGNPDAHHIPAHSLLALLSGPTLTPLTHPKSHSAPLGPPTGLCLLFCEIPHSTHLDQALALFPKIKKTKTKTKMKTEIFTSFYDEEILWL